MKRFIYNFLMPFTIVFLSICLYWCYTANSELRAIKGIQSNVIRTQDNLLDMYRPKIKSLEEELKYTKEHASILIALSPLKELISDDEIKSIISEIPKGNPFETGFQITSGFGEGTGYGNNPRVQHFGLDAIPDAWGKDNWYITSFSDGEVISYGVDRIHGKNIIIEHSDRVRTRYSHLSKIYYSGTTGKIVKPGTRIGIMGQTGWTKSPHLHFELMVRVNDDDWIQVNPRPFMVE